jgi:hypothetical protein
VYVWVSHIFQNKQRLHIFPSPAFNRSVFVRETKCISCKIKTELLYYLAWTSFSKPMLYGSGGYPRASHRGSPYSIPRQSMCDCGRQSGNGTGFSPSTSVFPSQYHSNITPYETFNGTLIRRACWWSQGTLNNSMFFVYRKAVDRKVFSHFYAWHC